ncbi:MAG: GIY-YIG nuclease family protein [Actinobacteria bacterium]|nr:GIY-YIG nuclease family protein [Actinomycetota bacterium]
MKIEELKIKGWIYIAANESIPGLLKIGFTDRDPIARMAELQTTGVPSPFVLIYQCLVEDAEALEREIHCALTSKRHATNREFFRCTVADAKEAVRSSLYTLKLDTLYETSLLQNVQESLGLKEFNNWLIPEINSYCLKIYEQISHEFVRYVDFPSIVDLSKYRRAGESPSATLQRLEEEIRSEILSAMRPEVLDLIRFEAEAFEGYLDSPFTVVENWLSKSLPRKFPFIKPLEINRKLFWAIQF